MSLLVTLFLPVLAGAVLNCDFWLQPVDQQLPMVAQETDYTCGVACVRSIAQKELGIDYSESFLAELLNTHPIHGTLPGNIINLVRQNGFEAELLLNQSLSSVHRLMLRGDYIIANITTEDRQPHYALIAAVNSKYVKLMDPWFARRGIMPTWTRVQFIKRWQVTVGRQRFVGSVIRIARRH